MRKIPVALGFVGLLLAGAAAADDRMFMGIQVGAKAPSECPTERTPFGTKRYSYSGAPLPCWSAIGGQPGSADFTNNGVTTVEIWVSSDSRPLGTAMPTADVVEGRIESISVETTGFKDQESLLEALTKKYGKPVKLEREPVQTGVGAKFDRIHASWKKPDLNVEFFGLLSSITSGVISVRTDAALARFQKQYGREKSF